MFHLIDNKKCICSVLLLYISFFVSGGYVVDKQTVSLLNIIVLHSSMLECFSFSQYLNGLYGDWFYILMPIILGMCCIPMICDELNSGYYKFLVSRMKNSIFQWKMLGTYLASAIVTYFCALLLYVITVCCIIREYNPLSNYGWLVDFDVQKYYMCELVTLAYYLMVSGVVFLLTVITANMYVSISVTFLLNYLVYQLDWNIFSAVFISLCCYIGSWHIVRKRWLSC